MHKIVALLFLPCFSEIHTLPERNETVAYACPNTAYMLVEKPKQPISPVDHAKAQHYYNLPRDDRMPPEVKKAVPEKKVQKKTKRKKSKRKKRRA